MDISDDHTMCGYKFRWSLGSEMIHFSIFQSSKKESIKMPGAVQQCLGLGT